MAKGESENGRKAAKSVEFCPGHSGASGVVGKLNALRANHAGKKMLEKLGKKRRKETN